MRSFKSSVILSLCLALANAQKATLSDVHRGTNLAAAGNGYIVEVDSSSNILTNNKRSAHETLYTHLNSRGVEFEVKTEFNTPDVFIGASVALKDASEVEQLKQAPGVTAVRPIVRIPRPKPLKTQVVGKPSDQGVPADLFSTHRMTGVDKLHKEGHFGKGVTIGILDTGIDYTHPALGGAFGPGNTVVGGYDFVGDAYNGENEAAPDNDPLDQCGGHGTHVAGIIASSPENQFNISGVAYGASLNAYRIFGCEGSVTDDIIVDALLKGFGDGNDILTLSLGGPDGWTESSSSVVASRIAQAGKIVTIAAGNEGASGSWFTSSPGNGLDVISVASIDNIVIPIQNATVSNSSTPHDPISYYDGLPLPITDTRPVYATSNDTEVTDDACNPLPDSTPDLSGYVVVIRRGSCTFEQKLDNVIAKGATAALFYNNVAGFASVSFGTSHADFPAAIILPEAGEFLVEEFNAKSGISLTFPQSGAGAEYPDEHGGLVSEFSTYGPTFDLYFKPAVAAPGGNILSTYPTTMGSYAVLSGTSMATPFVAGVAALLFEIKGKDYNVGRGARNLFESTAAPVVSEPSGDLLQTVTQQGSGLIDAYRAIKTEITLNPTELLLNDTANFKGEHQITITNTGGKEKSFKVKHVAAGTAQTIQSGSIFASLGPVPLDGNAASVKLSQESFKLGPGSSQTITVSIAAPEGLDAATLPTFSGFIEFSAKSESYRASYLGVAGSLKDQQILDNTDAYFQGITLPTLLDATGNVQNGSQVYTLTGEDYPTVLWRSAFGTPHLRADLVSKDISFKPSYPAESNSRRAFSVQYVETAEGSFQSVPVIGALYEQFYQPRNDDVDSNPYNTLGLDSGAFANGTQIPAGSYKVLLRTLKVTGNKENEDDYESWLSPVIEVQGESTPTPSASESSVPSSAAPSSTA